MTNVPHTARTVTPGEHEHSLFAGFLLLALFFLFIHLAEIHLINPNKKKDKYVFQRGGKG